MAGDIPVEEGMEGLTLEMDMEGPWADMEDMYLVIMEDTITLIPVGVLVAAIMDSN